MNLLHDTIFAPATAPGRAGVAIMRISGPQAMEALSRFHVKQPAIPRVATLAQLRNRHQEIIDQALLLWFPGPASFTGEDMLELHLHGSRAVLKEVINVLSQCENYRFAEAGEFARRAFFNGKLDLTAIEGLADLIDAETAVQRRQALQALRGHQGSRFEALRERVIAVLAHLEATIDFADEDIPASLWQQVQEEVEGLKVQMAAALAHAARSEQIREGFSVVLLGAPNAGKSSLLNALAQRDAAIVSTVAGTTRDCIEVHLDIGGYPVVLVDTAGIRDSADPVEQEGIRRARARAEQADIRLVLFDAGSLPALDSGSRELLGSSSIAVISKADAANAAIPEKIGEGAPMAVSAVSGQGLEALLARILALLQAENSDISHHSQHLIITRARHRQALEQALSCLNRFDIHAPVELACEELRSTAVEIGKITGKIAVDELLDRIFAEFCIGK